MKIASKIGSKFEAVTPQVKIKTVDVAVGETAFQLKVVIPLKKEMEQIYESITQPSKERIDAIFLKLSQPIKDAADKGGKDFLETVGEKTLSITDSDVVLNGTSLRNVATMTAMWEMKVESFFHLIKSETDEPVNETYEQIVEELPEEVIHAIVDAIESAVKPNYKTAKKN
jgi:hypothetical protein